MTERSAARPCAVLACGGTCTDPARVVNAAPEATLPYFVPLCPDHWRQVEQGAEWFAEERPGGPDRPGVDVVMGDELAKRGLTVADVAWRRGGFSPQLDPRRNFGILTVAGRRYGSDERVHLDLTLTPGVVAQLRAVLRLYPQSEDPR